MIFATFPATKSRKPPRSFGSATFGSCSFSNAYLNRSPTGWRLTAIVFGSSVQARLCGDGIEDGEEFSGDRDEGGFGWFAVVSEALSEGFEGGIEAGGGECCEVERGLERGAATLDEAAAAGGA